jgi:hypothetical protein
MPVDFENDSTVTDAMAKLAAAEAADGGLPTEAFEQSETGELHQTEAVSQVEGEQLPNKTLPTDTPATAEEKLKAAEAAKVDTQKPEAKVEDKNKSKFAADAERRDKSWKTINERKTALDAQETAFKQRESQIAQREQKLEQERAKSSTKYTPEQYETAAEKMSGLAESYLMQSKGFDKQAEEFEEAGDYAKAEQAKAKALELKEASIVQKTDAKRAKEAAEYLRKNPDPTVAQVQEKNQKALQHFTMEAAKKWPDLVKDGSEFQKQMASSESVLEKSGLSVSENPVLRYFVAEFVAEKSAAARVPDLERKLGEAEAKVKELELLTSPGGGKGSVQTQSEGRALTDEEEGEFLRQQAAARG